MAHKPNKQKSEESWWIEIGKTLGLSLFFSLGITHYVAQAFYVPSGSMKPTLQINDRLMVDKVSYHFRDPQRGDVVVFHPPAALGFKSAFVKRLIGIPGDRVEVRQGDVFVNGHRLAERYVSQPSSTFISTCSEGSSAFLAQQQNIPAEHYLFLGDNRSDSYDGRCWGLIAKKDLIGRAMFRYWPFNHMGSLANDKPHVTNSLN